MATFEHLHQCGSWIVKQCNTTIPDYFQHYKTSFNNKITPKLNQMKSFLVDQSTVSDERFLYQGLLEAYCWVTLCLLSISIFFNFGQIFLYMFISHHYASLLRFWGFVATIYASTTYDISEEKRRLCVLMWSTLNGTLKGCLKFDQYLHFLPPPVVVLTASIGFSTIFFNKKFGNGSRIVFITVTLAPGIMVTFLMAFLFGHLGFPYLIWFIMLIVATTVDLQLKIGRLREGCVISAFEQFVSVSLFTLINNLCMLLFADSYK